MSEMIRTLSAIEEGAPSGLDRLLHLVHDERRKPAPVRLRREKPVHTHEATTLVRGADPRLVDAQASMPRNSRRLTPEAMFARQAQPTFSVAR